jgi:catechol 2,3-dioxygenase-like lactoylglutathione lyase family enzyme
VSVRFNHTLVHCRDQERSAAFLAEVFGRPAPRRFGPFHVVDFDDGSSFDFHWTDGQIVSQHYAFLVDDADFDAIFTRVRARGLAYWADPAKTQPGKINHHYGGRGVYFEDPDGHFLEIITRPYGSE